MKTNASYLAVASLNSAEQTAEFVSRFTSGVPGYHSSILNVEPGQSVVGDKGLTHLWLVSGVNEVRLGMDFYWQTISAGDVVVLPTGAVAEFRNKGLLWTICGPSTGAVTASTLRRLRDIEDKRGGCNVGENAFRRLQLTWRHSSDGTTDGDNVLGCHVVWIAEATSRTHYHPISRSSSTGMSQQELYLVLDPAEFGLKADVGRPGVWTFPEPGDWSIYHFTALKPGDVCWIPAGVAHRAVDILACVIAVPGFKPDNDIYVDQDIAASSEAPHNEQFSRMTVLTGVK